MRFDGAVIADLYNPAASWEWAGRTLGDNRIMIPGFLNTFRRREAAQ